MKKIAIFCIAVLLFACFNPVFASDITEDLSVTEGCNTLNAEVPVLGTQKLVSNAQSMLLYELTSDSLMYAYNADTQISPASLVKILTALITIEQGQLDDAVTVRSETLAALPYDAMVVGLVAEEVLTVEDLLYCMMVGSGNDAAAVLADHIMGSQRAFVDEMNRYAEKLGCTNTAFTNVHGLHSQHQYTTARDIGKILAHALKNETFYKIYCAKEYTVPQTNKSGSRKLLTQNYLMNNADVSIYYDNRVIGGRTAVANDRTRHVASLAEDNGMKVLCVVMGSESQFEEDGYSIKVFGSYDETTKLLNLAFKGYKTAQILHPEQIVKHNKVLNGDSYIAIGTKDGALSVIPSDVQSENLIYRYVGMPELTAPVTKGQKLGVLQVWCGPLCIAQTELLSMNTVTVAGTEFDENILPPEESNLMFYVYIALAAIISGVILILFLILFMRWSHIHKTKNRSRINSRNRRRSR